jgi:HSP20 family protein
MDRLWERLTGDYDLSTYESAWAPSLDLADRGEGLVAELEVPGLDPRDIEISLTGDTLTISGERKREREEKHEAYHLVERSYGKFSRSIRLPATVNPDRVEASYKDGVLRITMDKIEPAKTRKIEVKAA